MYYLYDLILWFNSRGNPDPATVRQTLERYRTLLDAEGSDDGSIMLQEHWATCHEAAGDYARAASHRDRQAELVEALLCIGGPIAGFDHDYVERTRQAAIADRARSGDAV